MFKDKEKLYQIYHTILSMALTWVLTLIINQYYGLRIHIITCAVFSFLPVALIYLFDVNRKNSLRYVFLASLVPIAALLFLILKVNPVKWVRRILNWCRYYDGSDKLYKSYEAHFVMLFIALGACIIFYLLMKKQITKFLLAGILFTTMILFCVNKFESNKVVVGICIFYILTIIIEIYEIIYSRKEGRKEKKEGILSLAPICLLLVIIAVSLPSKPEPIQWKGVKSLYNNVRAQIDIWMTDFNYYLGNGEDEFSVAISHYADENGELGGGRLKKDDKVALKVSNSMDAKPLYLTGSVSDKYLGNRWEKSRKDYKSREPEYLLDYLELTGALSRLDQNTLKNNRFIERRLYKLKYNNIKTRTLFYPIKSSWFDMIRDSSDPNFDYSDIKFKKAAGNGTAYQYLYYDMNLDGTAFKEMLRNADAFSYKTSGIRQDNLEWLQKNMIFDDHVDKHWDVYDYSNLLEKRAESINKEYTQLPKELPDRVKELASRITEKYNNNYDRLKAIESYLRGYKYSLNPPELPKGRDFVDYFIFDSREGYCTSFATSMAVLGRCIGIPTRYVEGFLTTFDDKDKSGMIPVKNSQAHAWAEAYFEGVGWIPFEATPSYYEERYTKWEEYRKSGEVDAYDLSRSNYSEYMEGLSNRNQAINTVKKEKENDYTAMVTGMIIFLMIVFLLVLITAIYYNILRQQYKKEFNRADNNKKMYMTFLKILHLLKREGFVLNSQETILMFSLRVNDILKFDGITFPVIAKIFMKNRYGEEDITKNELNMVETFYRGLDRKRREELSRSRVFVDEFFFLAKKGYR